MASGPPEPPDVQPPVVPPVITQRTSSKKAQKQAIRKPGASYTLEHLQTQERDAKKSIKPSHSMDSSYWLAAAAASKISVEIYEIQTKHAIQKWKEEQDNDDGDEDGNVVGWWATEEARRLVENLKAAHFEHKVYAQQAEKVKQGGPLRRAFQAMFTTSQVGLGIQKAGIGKRTRSQQSAFKKCLIKAYGAGIPHPKKPKVTTSIYDTATGRELPPSNITAAHVVPHSLGPDLLVALFGVNVEGELDTPYNGLVLQSSVETAMNDGVITIVPDISDDPTTEEVAVWENKEPKEYRWRVIDDEADILDETILHSESTSMTIRDLDKQRLFFKTDMRPRARYLYFLFVVAQLKQAWRHEYRNDPSKVLKKQLGKGFWATKGRYLKRAFLLALADEIGYDTDFLENVPMEPGNESNNDEPDATGVMGIAQLLKLQKRRYEDDFEDEDENEDGY